MRLSASAAYRIAFTYAAAFALAVTALGIAVYIAADAEFRSQRDRDIAEEIEELSGVHGRAQLIAAIAEREHHHDTQPFFSAVFDRASGRQLGGALKTAMPPLGDGMVAFIDPAEGPDLARARTIDLPDGDRLTVAVDSETVEAIDATILGLFAIAFGAVIAISAVGGVVLARYLHGRLALIGDTTRAIVTGNLAVRVPVSPRNDEFDEAGSAVNAMLDRIAQLMENLRQVSSDVAHDLRTPLLRLRHQLERLDTDPDAAAKSIKESDALLALFAAILRISEVEGGGLARGFTPVDLSALVEDIAESYQPALTDSGHGFGWTIAPDVVMPGDREILAQAIINLLDNARVHTPAGTDITLRLSRADQTILLAVCDNGPGVAPGEHERLSRRFFRGDRSRSIPGQGLGLSLVSAVVGAHGGAMTIADNNPGLRVAISIPAAPLSG